MTLSEPPAKNETVTFDWAITGTATNPDDYTVNPSSGTTTLTNSNFTQTIIITIKHDTTTENTETVKLTIWNINMTKPTKLPQTNTTLKIIELKPT